MATYYVQFSSAEEPDRWHTVARVEDRELAEEMARLAGTAYMRLSLTSQFSGRVMSRSALKREGRLHHADWELGYGRHRDYGARLRERAARTLGQAWKDGGT